MPGRGRGRKPDRIKKKRTWRLRLDTEKIRAVLEAKQTEEPQERKTIPRKRRRRPGKRWSIKDFDLRDSISPVKAKQLGVWILEISLVLFAAFACVWYFGQRVSVVGESMEPVLENGDIVLVNRLIYNATAPKRGDIIVFKPKGNENSHYYTRRVIGLPGETVAFVEGRIYIDGSKLEESYESTEVRNVGTVGDGLKLGEGEYFVLGDNRDKSEDSRMADVGAVKRPYIYGKAWFVTSPLSRVGGIKK